ncbi:TrkA family potassium uptake protein [Kocuria coralli]|uniref:Trk system potassium uptake protein TrkA n=1 Tax=Kocuria coralli TaxID=1461025 RepID=A0A5J5KUN4_9MICC|nr:TrkA family potassium uptake protein [Kocuria coralli]KAA9393409.1 TrkA family potassium uptake protein [Kocuria coralli]
MKVAVVGAGSVGASIVRELSGHGHKVVVIDEKPDAIGRADLRNSHWIVGDACDPHVLREAQLEQVDIMVAATGDDKVNLVVSLMARSEFGVPRTVGRVNNPKNEWMFDPAWGVDVAVSTPRLITALVEEAVEVGDVVRLLNLQSDKATLNAYTVPHGHGMIATTVGEVPWPPDATLVAILRDGAAIAPTRDDVIEAEDELFFLATDDGEEHLQELLAP